MSIDNNESNLHVTTNGQRISKCTDAEWTPGRTLGGSLHNPADRKQIIVYL